MQTILRKEGVTGFYKGMPCGATSFPFLKGKRNWEIDTEKASRKTGRKAKKFFSCFLLLYFYFIFVMFYRASLVLWHGVGQKSALPHDTDAVEISEGRIMC